MLTTRHRNALRLAAGAACLLFILMSSGCTLPHLRAPSNALNDIPLNAELRALHCRIEATCAEIHLHVTSSLSPQAEMFPDGRLLINIGLLVATQDEAEIAFILAHESAHRRLKHQFARTPERRAQQEIAADAAALVALTEAGFDASAGLRLLSRLLDEAEAEIMDVDAGNLASGDPAPSPKRESVAQVVSRIEAMRDAVGAITPLDEAPSGADWQRLLAPYRVTAAKP